MGIGRGGGVDEGVAVASELGRKRHLVREVFSNTWCSWGRMRGDQKSREATEMEVLDKAI